MKLNLLIISLLFNINIFAQELVVSEKDERYGLYDSYSNRWKVLPEFDYGYQSEACFIFLKEYYISQVFDLQGELIDFGNYDDLYHCENIPNLFIVRTGNKHKIYDFIEKEILIENLEINDCDFPFMLDGQSYVERNSLIHAKISGKWGIIDIFGKILVPFEFDKIYCTNDWIDKKFLLKKNEKCFLFDGKKLKKIPEFNDVLGFWDNMILGKIENKTVFADSAFNITSSVKNYEFIPPYFFAHQDCKFGIISEEGKQICDYNYSFIRFDENFFFVEQDAKAGVLDVNGRIILNPEYSSVSFLYWEVYLFKIEETGKFGLTDISGKIILPIEYNDIIYIEENRIQVKKDKEFFYINEKGELIK